MGGRSHGYRREAQHHLPRDLAEMIRMKVRTGAYASNSEVIRDALRLWQEREATLAERRQWLRAKIDRSLADARPSWMPMTCLPISKHATPKNEAPLPPGSTTRPARHRRLHRARRSAGGETFRQDGERKCAFIGRSPHAGRARPELHEGLRSFPAQSYVISTAYLTRAWRSSTWFMAPATFRACFR